jgi:hypothetical protein
MVNKSKVDKLKPKGTPATTGKDRSSVVENAFPKGPGPKPDTSVNKQ